MPDPQSSPSKDKPTTPPQVAGQTSPHGDDVLREDWKKLSDEDKNTYFKSLSADKQDEFAQRVGMYDHAVPLSFSAPLKVGSIPWMKEKAYQLANWEANQLPTVGGIAGGVAGGAIGEAIDPAGGGVPGAIAGSGMGGGAGDVARQFVRHSAGLDKYDSPESKTIGNRAISAVKSGAEQMAAEATGQLFGKIMRPTLERSLAKFYNAGGIDYGDGMGEGKLKTVINDLLATEKAPGGKSLTIQDFVNTIDKTKDDAGKMADAALNAPVTVAGKTVLLRDMAPSPTSFSNLIKSFATKDEGVIKRASLSGSDPSVTAAKKYQRAIKDRALTFEQKPWTYGELARERIRINQELSDYYAMTPGEKQAFLKEHPLFEVDKAIADHIRDVTYPEMDKAAKLPPGTTKKLQEKRGILMQIDTEVRKNLNKLQTKTVTAQGEGLVDKVSPSGYITSEGKPGGSFHRVQRLMHTPNGIASANKKVSQAFGHAPLTAARKTVTTPFGSKKAGNEILSMPLRMLVDPVWQTLPDNSKAPQDEDSSGPQSSASTPAELKERAKQLNPAAQGQVAYNHTAIHPNTGHRVVSNDGVSWIDPKTGQKVA